MRARGQNYETPKTAQMSAFPTPPQTSSPPTTTMTPSSTYPNPALDTPAPTRAGPTSGSPHPAISYHRNFSRPTRSSITSIPLPPEPAQKTGLPTPPDSQKGSPELRQQLPIASQSVPDLQRSGTGPFIWSGSLAFASPPPANVHASPPPATATKSPKSRLSIDTQSSAGGKRTWPSSPVGTSPGTGLFKSGRWGGKKLSFGSSQGGGRRRGLSESSSSRTGPDWIDLGGGTKSVYDEPPVLAFTGDVGKRPQGTFEHEVEQRRREREQAWEREREAAEKEEGERRRREAEETEREVFRGEGYGHSTGAGRAAASWEGPMAPRSPYEDAYAGDRLAVPAPTTPQHDRTESANTARYSLYSLPPEEQLVYSRAASRLSWGKPLDRGAAGGVGEAPARHAHFDASTPHRSPKPLADLPMSMQKARALQARNGSVDQGKSTPQELLQLGIEAHERGDLSRSATLFERSARENGGCGAGMIMWGLALRHGWGCSVNQARGFKWLQKAAESVVEDLDKAVEQDRFVATDGGDGEAVVARNELVLAIYEMGQCFMRGWGCKKDKPLVRRRRHSRWPDKRPS